MISTEFIIDAFTIAWGNRELHHFEPNLPPWTHKRSGADQCATPWWLTPLTHPTDSLPSALQNPDIRNSQDFNHADAASEWRWWPANVAGFCPDGLAAASKIHQHLAALRVGGGRGGCCGVKAGRLPWRFAWIQMAPDRRGWKGPLYQQTSLLWSLSAAAYSKGKWKDAFFYSLTVLLQHLQCISIP